MRDSKRKREELEKTKRESERSTRDKPKEGVGEEKEK